MERAAVGEFPTRSHHRKRTWNLRSAERSGQYIARTAARGTIRRAGSIAGELLFPDPLGSETEIPLHGLNGSLKFMSGVRGGTIVSNEDAVGFVEETGYFHNIKFINDLDNTPGQFTGTSINAIVIRDVDGVKVGFGVSIQTFREAEIYDDGIARGLSSNEINARIVAERAVYGEARESHEQIRNIGPQAVLRRPYIPAETVRALGPPPTQMWYPHKHHILPINGRMGAERTLVREGQAILDTYQINPLTSRHNLVWAPNRGHTFGATEALVTDLRAARAAGESQDFIIGILRRHGKIAQDR